MRFLSILLSLVVVVGLSGCANKFRTYDGPEVTRVVVMKGDRRMYLMHHDQVLRAFDIEMGFAPDGHKTEEGDGRTPEGAYWINRRNPNSAFHLSIGISYPNAQDRAQAQARGVSPGGDIFIHGTPDLNLGQDDWTAGCIAVTNREMEDIYAMVRDGTPIHIFP
ncbi:L,D-transpeptidase family protein [Marivivens marinus]|uniref:L,D-transpeptidase family protein n=1 Tax=Marivivens marinus TaxID=3110173 RepID=UPI003B849CF2